MIHVAHDGDDGRTGQLFALHLTGLIGHDLDILFEGDDVGQEPDLPGDLLGHLGVEGLVDGGEDAPVEELGHDILGGAAALLGEFLDGHALGQHDDADLVLDVFAGDLLGAGAGLAELEIKLLFLAPDVAALLLLATLVGAATGALLAVGINGACGREGGATTWAAGTGAAGTTAGSTRASVGTHARTVGTHARAAGAHAGTAGAAGTAGTSARSLGPHASHRTGLGQLDVAGGFLDSGGGGRGVRGLDAGVALLGPHLGDRGRDVGAPRGIGRGQGLVADFPTTGVGGHLEDGLFLLRHAGPLDIARGLAGPLHDGSRASLGAGPRGQGSSGSGHRGLGRTRGHGTRGTGRGQLDVAGRFVIPGGRGGHAGGHLQAGEGLLGLGSGHDRLGRGRLSGCGRSLGPDFRGGLRPGGRLGSGGRHRLRARLRLGLDLGSGLGLLHQDRRGGPGGLGLWLRLGLGRGGWALDDPDGGGGLVQGQRRGFGFPLLLAL